MRQWPVPDTIVLHNIRNTNTNIFPLHLYFSNYLILLRPVLKKQITVDTLSYKTISANKATVDKQWVLIDAENKVLGRLSSEVAKILRGKHKPSFTPHVDCGDNVIIINAEKVKLTGRKMSEKVYVRHTGYPGGQRFATPELLMKKDPTMVVKKAVHGMLPKNKLGAAIRKNLFLYASTEHPHEAQKPKTITIK
jgi:large subunit ribosomal protein L13